MVTQAASVCLANAASYDALSLSRPATQFPTSIDGLSGSDRFNNPRIAGLPGIASAWSRLPSLLDCTIVEMGRFGNLSHVDFAASDCFTDPDPPAEPTPMPAPETSVLLVAGRMQVRGSSVQTLNLAQRLPDAGIQARVVCTDAQYVSPARRTELHLSEYSRLESPLLGRFARRFFARELEQETPDLIHIQQRSALPLGCWLAQRLKRPFVVSITDYLAPREVLPFDRSWGRGIIAVSESVRSELLERTKLPDDLVSVIHSGVEAPDEEHLRIPFQDGQTPVVGTAGPLEAAKGLHFFLQAIPRVLAAWSPVEFLIAGAGPEERGLRRMADDLGVTEFVTFVPNVFDVSTSLTAMDIYCLPSLKQGLGTIMLEAMARGKPVIASRVGGVYSAIEDGQNGLLVAPSDSTALAERIVELLKDQSRARGLGREARSRVLRDFPVERMVDETAAVYRRVLATA